MATVLLATARLGFGAYPSEDERDAGGAVACSAPTSATFGGLLPAICIYDEMPSLDALRTDLALVSEPSLAEIEASLTDHGTYAHTEMSLTPEDADQASTFAANFATIVEHAIVKGYWNNPLVRASYDEPMVPGEIVAYAGFPARDIAEAAEMSVLHVSEVIAEENHLRLKMLTGKQSLVVDGYYDFELSLSGTTSAVTCTNTKAGRFNPGLSAVGKALLTAETLQANNEGAVVRLCNHVFDFLKSDASCLADDSCFFSSLDLSR